MNTECKQPIVVLSLTLTEAIDILSLILEATHVGLIQDGVKSLPPALLVVALITANEAMLDRITQRLIGYAPQSQIAYILPLAQSINRAYRNLSQEEQQVFMAKWKEGIL
jgi:hypothetical protein